MTWDRCAEQWAQLLDEVMVTRRPPARIASPPVPSGPPPDTAVMRILPQTDGDAGAAGAPAGELPVVLDLTLIPPTATVTAAHLEGFTVVGAETREHDVDVLLGERPVHRLALIEGHAAVPPIDVTQFVRAHRSSGSVQLVLRASTCGGVRQPRSLWVTGGGGALVVNYVMH